MLRVKLLMTFALPSFAVSVTLYPDYSIQHTAGNTVSVQYGGTPGPMISFQTQAANLL